MDQEDGWRPVGGCFRGSEEQRLDLEPSAALSRHLNQTKRTPRSAKAGLVSMANERRPFRGGSAETESSLFWTES